MPSTTLSPYEPRTVREFGTPQGAQHPLHDADEEAGRQPRRPLTNWHVQHARVLTRGQRAADWLRNGMGSWTFIATFLALMGVWMLINTLALPWDPYPFILLNLVLSMLAGLQGAILLIAAKRQDALAAALAQHDYETNMAAKAEIEELMTLNRLQWRALEELRAATRGPAKESSNDTT